MISIPVNYLLNSRVPDRDILRALVLQSPRTGRQIRASLRLTYDAFHNAIDRLNREGLVYGRRMPQQHQRCAIEWYAGRP